MRTLRDRHVVVTGASSGIGAALARELARAGARLTLVARRKELLESLAAECGGTCAIVARDLSEPPAQGWLADAVEKHGPVDVLVNNAGMENTGPTVATHVEVGRRLLR